MRQEIRQVPQEHRVAFAELATKQQTESNNTVWPAHWPEMDALAGEVPAAMGLSSADGWQIDPTTFLVARRYVIGPDDMIQ